MDKVLFCIEYDFNKVSPALLWSCIATSDGLESWFADNVEINGKHFTFYWNSEKRSATQISNRPETLLRLRWEDDSDKKHYFEFKLTQNELTQNTSLIISDFALENEIKDCIDLWNEQIAILQKKVGV